MIHCVVTLCVIVENLPPRFVRSNQIKHAVDSTCLPLSISEHHRCHFLLIPTAIMLLLLCVCTSVVGFGVDPALRISVFDELSLGEGFDGVTQVQGFHSESRAFHFQGSSREVKAPAEVSEQMVQKLRGKNEFTVLATLKQDHLNSGVILSIHHSEHRYDQVASHCHMFETRFIIDGIITFI
uniref:Uncharacterized protein n=1 Tax=Acanthochromis polyacanthus TaxID=80966 RepID=A0A3Q1GBH3_9TELE